MVEAGSHSGSLITARCALEQGRDVYAVPGSVLSTDFAGTNDLINDGAYVVTQPVQLLSGYAERYHLDLNRVPACSNCWRRSRTRAPTCPKPQRSTILNGWRRGGSG